MSKGERRFWTHFYDLTLVTALAFIGPPLWYTVPAIILFVNLNAWEER